MPLTVTKELMDWLVENDHCPRVTKDGEPDIETFRTIAATAMVKGELTAEKYSELSGGTKSMSANPQKVFARGGNIRVKDPSEMYSDKRYTAKNRFGEAVVEPVHGVECTTMSDASKAMYGPGSRTWPGRPVSGMDFSPSTKTNCWSSFAPNRLGVDN